jgi:hypothetical protein
MILLTTLLGRCVAFSITSDLILTDPFTGRGQQQITVKHVTTNNVTADQAIIADSVTTGGARNVASPALLAAGSEIPMRILDEIRQPDPVGVGRDAKTK